jgi:hypothetical protein
MSESSLKIGVSKPFSVWFWAVVASLILHGVLMTAALRWKTPAPPKPRQVVPVEAITLATFRPGPPWGAQETALSGSAASSPAGPQS